MTFGITSFTFDPNNRVNLSWQLPGALGDFIQKTIFLKNETLSATLPEWTLMYYISSDKTFETLKVREEVKRSRKYKYIDHYVYFPRINGLGDTAPYPIEDFLEYFFEGLAIILRDFYNVEINNLTELKEKAKKRFIGKKKYLYEDDGTHLTTEEIRILLGK